MLRTLAAPGNTEDPVVGRRRGPLESPAEVRRYAAVVPAELPEPDEPDDALEPEPEPEPESDEEDEEDEEEEAVPEALDDAGELLDEEPRLSLR